MNYASSLLLYTTVLGICVSKNEGKNETSTLGLRHPLVGTVKES